MSCALCRLPYPEELLMPVTAPGHPMDRQLVCGICALDISNEQLGDGPITTINAFTGRVRERRGPRKRFDGQMAEDLRQRALAWRRKHPNAKPETRKAS